ncbi:hypothetical protein AB0K43_29985 [Kitasatospora sp. NPDC049258]|uniref:hypothetical protein n=1 Tax=Kitasatospora sp. NPDC049258 TaxID=3155394 RepID=UPI0034445E3E
MLRPIVSRFPASELADRTSSGDYIRVVATVQDYARKTGTCFASDQTIADQLGLSRGGVNRLIARAEARGVITSRPNPDRGTMDRQVAPITADTLVVCVSAHARSALAGTRFKVYGLLVLRQHLDEETTIARIAADCALTENTARAAVADLVADGWVSREGDNGCAHRFRTHPVPIAGVPTQDALFPQPRQQARPADNTTAIQAEDAPTGPADPGQLPLFTDPPPAPTPPVPVTGTPLDPVTATPPVPVTRTRSPYQDLPNRQSARGGDGSGEAATSVPRARADRPATTRPATARAGLVAPSADPRKTPAPPPTTALPPLTVSAEVHQVLRQVPSLVARMSRWQQREAARAVGRAIRAARGVGPRGADRVEIG